MNFSNSTIINQRPSKNKNIGFPLLSQDVFLNSSAFVSQKCESANSECICCQSVICNKFSRFTNLQKVNSDSDIVADISRLCKNDKRTLFFLMMGNKKYKRATFTQQTIANFSGVQRQAGHKSIHRLERGGFIKIDRNSNVYSILSYRVAPQYMTIDAQFKLMPYFASIGLVSQTYFDFFEERKLGKFSKKFLAEKRTQKVNLNLFKYFNNQVSRYCSKSNSLIVRGRVMIYDKNAILGQLRSGNLEIDPIRPDIQTITSVKLTHAGKIDLTCFEKEALAHADKKVRMTSGVRNPFALLCKIAQVYSLEHGLCTDRDYSRELARLLKISESAPRYETSLTQEIALTPFANTGQHDALSDGKKGATISGAEATRCNEQTMIQHMGSRQAYEEWSKQYESSRPKSDLETVNCHEHNNQKQTCWTEPIENIIKNLGVLRDLANTNNRQQRDMALTAIRTLENVLAVRIDKQSSANLSVY